MITHNLMDFPTLAFLRRSLHSPMMTCGGETRVRMRRQRTKMPTMMPSRLMRSMSVILIAFADRTRKITDILGESERGFLRC